MKRLRLAKAGTGLAVGALVTAPLLGVFTLGSLAGITSVPFTVFEWLIRVLPGRMVIFGLDLTVRVLEGLGFNIKNTAKTAEQVLALSSLFVAGLILGLLFFVFVSARDARRVRRLGWGLGAIVGLFSVVICLIQNPPGSVAGQVGIVIWVLALFLGWGWGMGRLYLVAFGETLSRPAPDLPPTVPEVQTAETVPMEARAISRRRFLIQMGGLVATILVIGADVGEVLRAQAGPKPQPVVNPPVPFPNAGSPVELVPGTRAEYTPVADHYQIDIDLTAPDVDPATWRLAIEGLVDAPQTLTIDQIRAGYASMNQFVTLSCISNPVAGPLIGTTLWTGVPLRDVLAQAKPQAAARFAHIFSKDGFHESVDLALAGSDPRIMLTHAWNGQPLPAPHGFPLRVYIPDRYGMKQPKWIERITLEASETPGYWVSRAWDAKAEMRTTSVIDTVATDALIMRAGRNYVPIGGIAHAGAKGISKVEIQVDEGAWEAAELRAPLSGLTWVLWRYEWPFTPGRHTFRVRAYDGQGRLQETKNNPSFPSGATGIHELQPEILPIKL